MLGGRLAEASRRTASNGALWIALAVAVVMAAGVLHPVEDGLSAARFKLLRRPASHQITVVEIDQPSVQAAGRWPWGRDRFARAVSNLEAAGAKVVGFDVDFSAGSSDQADQTFAQAIGARPGSVILPTFVQPVSDGAGGTRLVESSPLQSLVKDALLASVNIPVDPDGRVRHYRYGFGKDEGFRRSMGAEMAEVPGQRADAFIIDYSVRATDIPHLSFNDVYENRFDPALVKGRDILIGATALELGDEFSTPQSGTLNGVYIHAIAFESLRAGRGLISPGPIAVLALALGLIFLLRPTRPDATLRSMTVRHISAAACLLGLPAVLQALLPVTIPVAPLLLAQGLCLVWTTRVELARRARAIVEERESGLLHLAMHEPETGLPNRRALLSEITARTGSENPGAVAVIAVGIDRFQTMRGAVGYSLSSEIVRAVAARLGTSCGDAAVAHLSTSVLGMVLQRPTQSALEAQIAALAALDSAHTVAGHPVDAFLKFGVAHLCEHDSDPEQLLEHATLAFDQARRDDVRIVAFDPKTYADPGLNLALMSEMRRGLREGQLDLHYQPKLSLADGMVRGAEALIRWKHPERGNIRPDVFIGIAEETSNIRELTAWTLRRALEDGDRLRATARDVLLSVNISGRLLTDQSFCDDVLAMVAGRRHGLCLEITETAVISNPVSAAAAIAAFRAAGLKISIDDYGVGLSSVSYLKMLDAHELKIDKSLVESAGESERDRLILKSTVDLAHGLGMVVVAEGVEDAALQDTLSELGCDLIQGYLVSKPLPFGEFDLFLRAWPKPQLAKAG